MPDTRRSIPPAAKDSKKRVRLFGPPRILPPADPDVQEEPKSLPTDPAVLELLALLVLAREFLPPDSVAKQDGEVRRDFLAATLFPALFDREPQGAREKVRYLLSKLDDALDVRPVRQSGERERGGVRVQWTEVWIDVLRLRDAARHPHATQMQQVMVALAARPLLEGTKYGWLEQPAFLAARANLDAVYLFALAHRADTLLLSMERAGGVGHAEADTFRAEVLPLLDRAAERLQQFPHPLLAEFDARFAELRRRVAYPLPDAAPAVSVSRLPQPTTAFFGREQQIDDVRTRLLSGRMVTLTGMGGGGKTRLALQVATALEADGEDVRWTELASVATLALLPARVATDLGVAEQSGVSVADALVAFLQSKSILLVLDNCEHLLTDDDAGDDCATFAAHLLRSCAGLRVLATSRRPLNINGESAYLVPPLPVPPLAFGPSADPVTALLSFDGARLFADRAGHIGPFTVQAEHVASIAAICTSLDGIPLAIELAAARVKSLPLERIAEMLADRFGLLVHGRRDSPARHKTLRAVIDWSYDLLRKSEQELLCRLSVFAGGWELDAAEAIGTGLDVLELLTGLVDKSLVIFDASRYRMLETVRQYAQDRLRERGEWDETRRRHRECFFALAEQAEPELRGPEQKRWLDTLDTEHDNLRTALAWRTDETALRLACTLSRFWWERGFIQEELQWLERNTEVEVVSEPVQANVLLGAGRLFHVQGKFELARHNFQVSLALWTKLNDKDGMANAFYNLASVDAFQGQYEAADTHYRKSLSLFREKEIKHGVADSLMGMAVLDQNQGRYEQAEERHQESLALRRELCDSQSIALSLMSMGDLAFRRGALTEGRDFLEEALTRLTALQHKHRLSQCHIVLARILFAQGQGLEAKQHLYRSLDLARAAGKQWDIAQALNYLATWAYEQEDYAEAESLLRQSVVLMQQMSAEKAVAAVQANLGDAVGRLGKYAEAEALFQQSLRALHGSQDGEILASILELYAVLIAEQGFGERGITLCGAASALAALVGFHRPANEDARYELAMQAARQTLGTDTFAEAWARGHAMTREEATAFALEDEQLG